jgi:hypothetical protein
MSMKNSNDTAWDRTRNIPACSTVPHSTAPRLAPTKHTNSSVNSSRQCTISLSEYISGICSSAPGLWLNRVQIWDREQYGPNCRLRCNAESGITLPVKDTVTLNDDSAPFSFCLLVCLVIFGTSDRFNVLAT